MGWSELSKIDLKSRENVLLYWIRPHPIVYALFTGALFALTILSLLVLIDPNYRPHAYYGRGAWLVALLVLLPVAVRIILAGIMLGFLVEGVFRHASLIYGKLPAFVIGPNGIAALNPWSPRALTWSEIRAYRRHVTKDRLGIEQPTAAALSFGAPGVPPRWLPQRLRAAIPSAWTERRIEIDPSSVGLTEQELVETIERFAGPIVFEKY